MRILLFIFAAITAVFSVVPSTLATPVPVVTSDAVPLHAASGVIKSWTDKDVTIAHGPVASLGWPAMTMQFSLNEYHGDRFSPGQAVNFTFRNSGSTFSLTTVSAR